MAFNYVGEVTYAVSGGSTSIPFSSLSVTAGDLIVVGFRWEGGGLNDSATISVSDTGSNVWAGVVYSVTGAPGEDQKVALTWAEAASTSSIDITGTISSSRSWRQGYAANFSSSGSLSSASNITGGSSTNTTTVNIGNISANNGDLVVGTVGNYNSGPDFVAGSGYTLSGVTTLNAFEYKVAASTGSHAVDGTMSSADTWAGIGIVFSEGGGGVAVDVPVGSLAFTGYAPTPSATDNKTISIPASSILLTGYAPTIQTGSNVDIPIPAGALSISGLAPSIQITNNIDISIPVGSLLITGYAPTTQAGNNVDIDIPSGSLALTGYAPLVLEGNNIAVDIPAGSLVLTGYAPFVDVGNIQIPVPAGSLVFTGYAPNVITVASPDLLFSVIGRIDGASTGAIGRIITTPLTVRGDIIETFGVIGYIDSTDETTVGRINSKGQSVKSEL